MFERTEDLEIGRLVFTEIERPLVEAHPDLAVFSTLTGAHVIGLLQALGEYTTRSGSLIEGWEAPVPEVWSHPEAAERHDALRRFWRTRRPFWGPVNQSDEYTRDITVKLPEPGRLVFLPATREHLAVHKYIKGLEELSVTELCSLLGRVAGYSAVAQAMPDFGGGWIEGPCRRIHGHNQLVSFARLPFTYAEFCGSADVTRRAYERRSTAASAPAGS